MFVDALEGLEDWEVTFAGLKDRRKDYKGKSALFGLSADI